MAKKKRTVPVTETESIVPTMLDTITAGQQLFQVYSEPFTACFQYSLNRFWDDALGFDQTKFETIVVQRRRLKDEDLVATVRRVWGRKSAELIQNLIHASPEQLAAIHPLQR